MCEEMFGGELDVTDETRIRSRLISPRYGSTGTGYTSGKISSWRS